MENMRFKVGDRVRIKSLDWYNENKDKDGFVDFSTSVFALGMSQFCGKIVTIEDVFEEEDDVVYCMEGIDYDWTDEMIEGLVEEEEIEFAEEDKYWCDIVSESDPTTYVLPQGYQFKDENGNVINATKIVLEKKKKEYPKTYEECAEVLCECAIMTHGYKRDLLNALQKLLICRDAYWKIASDWIPEFRFGKKKYCIMTKDNKVISATVEETNRILVFPTEEMRDAFKENFKELIEQCKELL